MTNLMGTKTTQTQIVDPGFTYQFEDVLISFPQLDKPVINTAYPNNGPKYGVTSVMTQAELEAFLEAMQKHIDDKGLPAIRNFDTQGVGALHIQYKDDEKSRSDPRLYKHYTKSFKSIYAVPTGVIDPELGQLITLEPHQIQKEIYSGCICVVEVKVRHRKVGDKTDPNAQPGDYSFFLTQVIKVGEGDRLGGGAAANLGEGIDLSKYGVTKKANPPRDLYQEGPIGRQKYQKTAKPKIPQATEAELADVMDGL